MRNEASINELMRSASFSESIFLDNLRVIVVAVVLALALAAFQDCNEIERLRAS